MSDEQKSLEKGFDKVSLEDAENIRNYAKHYKVAIPPYLEEALKAFEENITMETFVAFKKATCYWILTSENDSFNDDLWAVPKAEAKKIVDENGINFDE